MNEKINANRLSSFFERYIKYTIARIATIEAIAYTSKKHNSIELIISSVNNVRS